MSITSDIIQVINYHPGIHTDGILELLENLGYYRAKSQENALSDLNKKLTHLKRINKVTVNSSISSSGREQHFWTAILPSVEKADDHFPQPDEMASDLAELAQPSVNRVPVAPVLEPATTPDVVNHDAPRNKTRPYTPNKISGAYAYRGALVIKLDRRASAKSITLGPKDMALLTSLYGNMT